MRVERLVIEAGEDTFSLDLHPRLTVVAGMGEVERESLLAELIGALEGVRPGVHLELVERSQRHLAVFRPTVGPHRIVDVDQVRDVTRRFAGGDGVCDLLRHLGIDAAQARQAMRFGADDLVTTSERGRAIEMMAGLDQRRLWAAAEALQRADGDLSSEAEARGTVPEDAAVIEAVEARHFAHERAAERLDATRRRTMLIGGASSLATVPAVVAAGPAGLGFLVVAALAVMASLIARLKLERAAQAEAEVLAAAGAGSYLGFQLQRVNSLLGDDDGRRALMDAAGMRRAAQAEWQQLVSDLPVEWALAHREEVQAAARLRRDVDALAMLSSTAPAVTDDQADELAHALVTRLAHVRTLGGEGLPLVLDDPFRNLEPSMKPLLLELLGRTAGEPQVVFLTDDEEVASWARLEAQTGDVALVEPSTSAESVEEPDDRDRKAAVGARDRG